MDMIMFGFNDWHQWAAAGFRTRCGAVARLLAENDSIDHLLIVSTPRSFAKSALNVFRTRGRHDVGRIPTLKAFATRQVGEKVFVLDHNRLLPRETSCAACYELNGYLHDGALRSAILRACAEIGMRDWVLWVSDPFMAKHFGHLGETLSVFDAIDDWSAHPENKNMRRRIEEGYGLVAERADVVFTVSKSLAERFDPAAQRVSWQPNGVDSTRFTGEPGPIPGDLANLPRPILGYVGVIQERLDVAILAALAEAMPSASIALIGPVRASRHVSPLEALKNVHFLGERAAHTIPDYVRNFDVALVPHTTDAFTQSMDPLKIYEYLAAGMPVVASGLPEMNIPDKLVARCATTPEFIGAVKEALLVDGKTQQSLCQDRVAFATSRSWNARVTSMLEIIREAPSYRQAVQA
ncbi:MAG: glycosyltransferase [Coriobacteriia bacterium]